MWIWVVNVISRPENQIKPHETLIKPHKSTFESWLEVGKSPEKCGCLFLFIEIEQSGKASLRLPRFKPLWRNLILRIWGEDPLLCPAARAKARDPQQHSDRRHQHSSTHAPTRPNFTPPDTHKRPAICCMATVSDTHAYGVNPSMTK
jgi:hypothetical protein